MLSKSTVAIAIYPGGNLKSIRSIRSMQHCKYLAMHFIIDNVCMRVLFLKILKKIDEHFQKFSFQR